MKKYALFHGDEDGNCVTFLDDGQLQELLEDPNGNHGIETFVSELEDYPENWSTAEGMIVEIKVLMPKQKTVAWRLEDEPMKPNQHSKRGGQYKDADGNNLPTIVEALQFRMEQYGHNNRQAAKAIGISEQKVCHILKGQRDISRSMQWKLYEYGIPPIVLIQPRRKDL